MDYRRCGSASFFETDAIWDEVFVYPMKMARISTPGKIGYEIL
jgi:hypothetical protein